MDIQTVVLPNISAAAFFAEKHRSKDGKGILFVCRDEQEAEDFISAFKTFAQNDEYTYTFFGEDKYSLNSGLYNILTAQKALIAAALYTACAKDLPAKRDFAQSLINLATGQSMLRAELLAKLEKAGYERADFTEKSGQYAVRGSVVDIFSPNYDAPCRLYFSGNLITTLALFDVETQNTKSNLAEFTAVPLFFEHNNSNKPAFFVSFFYYVRTYVN